MKQKPLTFTLYVGGKQVDRLTDEQAEKISVLLSERMSAYYTAHPDEYKKIRSGYEKHS